MAWIRLVSSSPFFPRRLHRRSPLPFPDASSSSANGPSSTPVASACGPQCIMLIAGAAAGVLLAVLLVLGILIYKRRRAQEDEDDMLA